MAEGGNTSVVVKKDPLDEKPFTTFVIAILDPLLRRFHLTDLKMSHDGCSDDRAAFYEDIGSGIFTIECRHCHMKIAYYLDPDKKQAIADIAMYGGQIMIWFGTMFKRPIEFKSD